MPDWGEVFVGTIKAEVILPFYRNEYNIDFLKTRKKEILDKNMSWERKKA